MTIAALTDVDTNATERASIRLGAFLVSPQLLVTALPTVGLLLSVWLRHLGVLAPEPSWAWLVVCVAVPVLCSLADAGYRRQPTALWRNVRTAVFAAAVTGAIYLTGWGPVLVGAFAILALDRTGRAGSEARRETVAWSLTGMLVGQALVIDGWAPSFLSLRQVEFLGALGVVVLLVAMRMIDGAARETETAEASSLNSEDRFRSLVQNSSDTTLVIDDDGVITYASPACLALVGLTPAQLVGRLAAELIVPDDRHVSVELGRRLQLGEVVGPAQFRIVHMDAAVRHVEAVVADLRGRASVAGYVANIRDITERREFETLLEHQALHDPVTGLPNRTLVLDRADQMLSRGRRASQPVAAFFVDLDNFKGINDTFGHQVGDALLRAVGRRLSSVLRSSDTVARMGGDEFVVLAEGVSLGAGPELVAERLHDVMRDPFALDAVAGVSLSMTISVGIASGDRASAEDLLRDADTALHRAKAMGKHRTAVFEPQMHSDAVARLELEMDLRAAVSADQFFLLYQPVFSLQEVSAQGVEALLRWRHPTRGVLPPDQFIPILEETGLIVEVGRWVLAEACAQAAAWRGLGYDPTMSVNVSMRQLETGAFADQVRESLEETGLPADRLILEITETALIRDAAVAVERLIELKSLGVKIAIDDFGTGYSSLAHLSQFPVDSLKIDRSFVAAMAASSESMALIHTLVELGRALGLETLAEGIEDQTQLEALQRERCQSGQGFLFSRPVEPAEVESFLRRTLQPIRTV